MTGPLNQIDRVAVIGAGISGVVTAAHLLNAGLEVTVFERNKEVGGVWLFDDRQPVESIYPSIRPSEAEKTGDYEEIQETDRIVLEHAPPGPCYVGLRNNVSTPLMRVTLNAWPDKTPDFVSHRVMNEYIIETSRKSGVHAVTLFGAKVTNIEKVNEKLKWRVSWTELEAGDEVGKVKEQNKDDLFDAVVVASGHYHAPRIPDIPGLADIKRLWPSRVFHSKGYRRPDSYAGKNVLLIGGGVSSTDIARELGPVAKSIYQSTRNGPFDLGEKMLPENGTRVAEIASFDFASGRSIEEPLTAESHLPVKVQLKSTDQGTTIDDVDYVIVCTGYHFTLPFLRRLHEDDTAPTDASDTVLVTDGTQLHNLHKDIFYIPDPTLAFIGVPFYTATFTLFEFQAIALAEVFAGIARLPSGSNMREEYRAKVDQKGLGRNFHSLRGEEEGYVEELLDWINFFRDKVRLPPIAGYTETWHEAKEIQRQRIEELFGITR
ncbi:FAD dependent oxidoreductase, putative [Talaromyces stipitatus ATCC 10500]|uniref:FAD dependent oxidoreductase, putative n=1 Tax=Talaromyces stipitatus (strain ATCC 10500 / CBS 375.48 / QM 6759 / NRRL 1006) TaxID=441959 RepID=B8MJ13_TALSN|nr:FAD dependent oxidoreductase, putative [Talaromyces stipitatus ATCC 10500]EED15675.1 FAD dependent oxidoreductase, putative [Talaromyces stipitatus ATCC 10500]